MNCPRSNHLPGCHVVEMSGSLVLASADKYLIMQLEVVGCCSPTVRDGRAVSCASFVMYINL